MLKICVAITWIISTAVDTSTAGESPSTKVEILEVPEVCEGDHCVSKEERSDGSGAMLQKALHAEQVSIQTEVEAKMFMSSKYLRRVSKHFLANVPTEWLPSVRAIAKDGWPAVDEKQWFPLMQAMQKVKKENEEKVRHDSKLRAEEAKERAKGIMEENLRKVNGQVIMSAPRKSSNATMMLIHEEAMKTKKMHLGSSGPQLKRAERVQFDNYRNPSVGKALRYSAHSKDSVSFVNQCIMGAVSSSGEKVPFCWNNHDVDSFDLYCKANLGLEKCGDLACAASSMTCFSAIMNMVEASVTVAINILTMGYGSSATGTVNKVRKMSTKTAGEMVKTGSKLKTKIKEAMDVMQPVEWLKFVAIKMGAVACKKVAEHAFAGELALSLLENSHKIPEHHTEKRREAAELHTSLMEIHFPGSNMNVDIFDKHAADTMRLTLLQTASNKTKKQDLLEGLRTDSNPLEAFGYNGVKDSCFDDSGSVLGTPGCLQAVTGVLADFDPTGIIGLVGAFAYDRCSTIPRSKVVDQCDGAQMLTIVAVCQASDCACNEECVVDVACSYRVGGTPGQPTAGHRIGSNDATAYDEFASFRVCKHTPKALDVSERSFTSAIDNCNAADDRTVPQECFRGNYEWRSGANSNNFAWRPKCELPCISDNNKCTCPRVCSDTTKVNAGPDIMCGVNDMPHIECPLGSGGGFPYIGDGITAGNCWYGYCVEIWNEPCTGFVGPKGCTYSYYGHSTSPAPYDVYMCMPPDWYDMMCKPDSGCATGYKKCNSWHNDGYKMQCNAGSCTPEFYTQDTECPETHQITDQNECKAAFDILGYPATSIRYNYGLKRYQGVWTGDNLQTTDDRVMYKGCFWQAMDETLELEQYEWLLQFYPGGARKSFPTKPIEWWGEQEWQRPELVEYGCAEGCNTKIDSRPLKFTMNTENKRCMDYLPDGYSMKDGYPWTECILRGKYEHICKLPGTENGDNSQAAQGDGYTTREFTYDCNKESVSTTEKAKPIAAKTADCKPQRTATIVYDDSACTGLEKPRTEDTIACGAKTLAGESSTSSCLPGSQGVQALDSQTNNPKIVPLKDLKSGDRVHVVDIAGKKEKKLTHSDETVEVLGWATRDEEKDTDFLEFSCGHAPYDETLHPGKLKRVRMTEEHYAIYKTNVNGEQAVMKAKDLKNGYFLPVWDGKDLTWLPIVGEKERIVKEKGIYVPLLAKAGDIVTEEGIVVPLLSQGHDISTNEETSDLTAAEAYEVYSAWAAHYIKLRETYPCLVAFDREYKQTVVTELMKQYFSVHKHDVKDAMDPFAFIKWLNSDTDAVVGTGYAAHLKTSCADLFKEE